MEAWPLPIGNAAQIEIHPPADMQRWRCCRGLTAPATQNDGVIYEGRETSIVDYAAANDTLYHYAAWFTADGAHWTGPQRTTLKIVPDYGSQGTDVQSLVRDRLRDGLVVELAGQRLPAPPSGSIDVFTAPPRFDSAQFPCISVHLDTDSPAERGLGDSFFDVADIGVWYEGDGWINRIELTIVGWCLNPDERIALRQSIKRLIIGNFPVFDGAGLVQAEFHQTDEEDFQSYSAPMYMTRGRFSCLVPYAVTRTFGPIADVIVTAIPEN